MDLSCYQHKGTLVTYNGIRNTEPSLLLYLGTNSQFPVTHVRFDGLLHSRGHHDDAGDGDQQEIKGVHDSGTG